MISFQDVYHNKVTLSFEKNPFSSEPKHVWVICRYEGRWLLTRHSDRGLEFPGGKVEQGEIAEEAAVREVAEETGGIIASLEYIGQYKVIGKDKIIVKNIYFAEIESLQPRDDYMETYGPVLLDELPDHIGNDKRFSFIMKDKVLYYSMQKVLEYL